MAQIRYIQHNGQRIEIPEGQVKYETRCDICGEYVADEKTAHLTVSVTQRPYPTITTTREGHLDHITETLAELLGGLRYQAVPF